MATFLTRNDYTELNFMEEEELNELLRFDDNKIDSIEGRVLAFITSYLNARYDAATELAKTGAARHAMILHHAVAIGTYYMHRNVTSNKVEAKVLDDYIEAKEWFTGVNDGTLVPTGIAEFSEGERNYLLYGGETKRENRL